MNMPAQLVPTVPLPAAPIVTRLPPRAHYVELKTAIHRKLLNRLNLEALAQADRPRAESEIRTLVSELLAEHGTPISLSERETLFGELIDEVFGLGPL
jgi:pilus assembly protein CpaF